MSPIGNFNCLAKKLIEFLCLSSYERSCHALQGLEGTCRKVSISAVINRRPYSVYKSGVIVNSSGKGSGGKQSSNLWGCLADVGSVACTRRTLGTVGGWRVIWSQNDPLCNRLRRSRGSAILARRPVSPFRRVGRCFGDSLFSRPS